MKMQKTKNKEIVQVVCPACGYRMPIYYEPEAESSGVRVRCKGRNCTEFFEIKIHRGQQIK